MSIEIVLAHNQSTLLDRVKKGRVPNAVEVTLPLSVS